MAFKVRFFAHCGMLTVDEEYDDRTLARNRCAGIIQRRRRDDHPVLTVERGQKWDVSEPDYSFLIPDTAGILALDEVRRDEEE